RLPGLFPPPGVARILPETGGAAALHRSRARSLSPATRFPFPLGQGEVLLEPRQDRRPVSRRRLLPLGRRRRPDLLFLPLCLRPPRARVGAAGPLRRSGPVDGGIPAEPETRWASA